MKHGLALAALFTTGVLMAAQSGSSGVIHLDPAKVTAALAKSGSVVIPPDLLNSGVRGLVHRQTAGQAQVHDTETDVLYVLDGAATVVTGGKMVGGKMSRPGQWSGSDITGGQTYHIAKGDVFVVPAGVPHWFKEIPKSISYFEVKVLKP
jgi:mannose-6-phosphate isomerase-like protein (cupin superfamily)